MIKRVVIAPHCDDETLGCGGMIAKHRDDTGVVVLAKPDECRLEEFRAARSILGYQNSLLLDLADGYVGADMHSLVAQLDEVLAEWQPQELYLPFPSMHQDHISAYEAGIRSSRLSMRGWHWFPPRVLVYDVAVYDVVMYPTDLRWNVFEALDRDHIDAKVKALGAYTSQQPQGSHHPVNGIRETACALGAARLLPYAEQFAAVREVRR